MGHRLRSWARLRLVLYVLVIACAWGLMYTSYKVGLRYAGPLWLATLRFEFFAVAALVAALSIRGALHRPKTRGDWAAVAAYAGLNVTFHNIATIGGAGHVPTATIGVLAGTTPILTAAFARWILPNETVGRRTLLGLVCGFAGVAVLTFVRPDAGGVTFSGWSLLVLAGFSSWALGTVLIRASGSALHGLALGLWGSITAILVLQPTALITEPMPEFTPILIGVAAFAGLVGGVLAFLLWLALVRTYGPRNANLVSYVSPIATTLSGFVFLGEAIPPGAIVAYAIIVIGLALVVRDFRPSSTNRTEAAADAADLPDA